MATSSITRSAAATPPLDHALSRVRVAAYDLVGPVASCRTNAAAVAESSFSGTTCVAIPSAPASRPEIGSPSMANRDARARPARSAIRCRAPAIGSIAVVTSTQRKVAFSAATRKSHANASSNPPPNATPCTTATVGILSISIVRYETFTSATNVLNQLTSLPGHSRTSPPKLKCGPSERTSSTRMSLSLAWCTAIRKASAKRRSSRLKGGLASTMFPIAPSRSNRIVVIVALLLWPTSGRALIGGSRDDGQQQMRWPLGIPVDPVGHGLAAANVVWNVFDVGHRAGAGRNIHGCDVEADPVTRLELVCRGEDLDPVLDHLSWLHGSNRILRELVERLPGLGTLLIESPIGRFQPASRQLAFGQRRRNIAFTLARGTNGHVG